MPGIVDQSGTVPSTGLWLPGQPDNSRQLEPLDAAHVSVLRSVHWDATELADSSGFHRMSEECAGVCCCQSQC